jgi:hypothetical protein
MKRTGFIALAVFLSLACGFSSSANLNNSQANAVNQATPKPENKNATPAVAAKTDALFVILGAAYLRDGKVELEENFWGHEENKAEAASYSSNKIELDILNCAGYIASAETTYKMENGSRRVKIIPETIAADAAEKIKQCAAAPNDKILQNKVFAVAPRDEKRRNVKIEKIDAAKIFDSLVKDVKGQKIEKDSEPQFKGAKGALSLESDNWTDLNGDGRIDLIEFHDAPCENENDSCTWIFRLAGGKWKKLEYVSPL